MSCRFRVQAACATAGAGPCRVVPWRPTSTRWPMSPTGHRHKSTLDHESTASWSGPSPGHQRPKTTQGRLPF